MTSLEILLTCAVVVEGLLVIAIFMALMRLFRIHTSKMRDAKELFERVKPAMVYLQKLLKEKEDANQNQQASEATGPVHGAEASTVH
jgi:hypothetical protein